MITEIKIKAFTVVELLVAMIISGIAISLAAGLYLNIEKLFNDQLAQYDETDNVLLFRSFILNDFENAQTIFSDVEGIEIISDKNQMINYNFEGNCITRVKEQRTDTFYLDYENPETDTFNDELDLVNEFSIDIRLGEMLYPLTIRKEYSRSVLFNLNYKKN